LPVLWLNISQLTPLVYHLLDGQVLRKQFTILGNTEELWKKYVKSFEEGAVKIGFLRSIGTLKIKTRNIWYHTFKAIKDMSRHLTIPLTPLTPLVATNRKRIKVLGSTEWRGNVEARIYPYGALTIQIKITTKINNLKSIAKEIIDICQGKIQVTYKGKPYENLNTLFSYLKKETINSLYKKQVDIPKSSTHFTLHVLNIDLVEKAYSDAEYFKMIYGILKLKKNWKNLNTSKIKKELGGSLGLYVDDLIYITKVGNLLCTPILNNHKARKTFREVFTAAIEQAHVQKTLLEIYPTIIHEAATKKLETLENLLLNVAINLNPHLPTLRTYRTMFPSAAWKTWYKTISQKLKLEETYQNLLETIGPYIKETPYPFTKNLRETLPRLAIPKTVKIITMLPEPSPEIPKEILDHMGLSQKEKQTLNYLIEKRIEDLQRGVLWEKAGYKRASKIAKELNTKREKIYPILESLTTKNLVTTRKIRSGPPGKTTLYAANWQHPLLKQYIEKSIRNK